MIFSARIFDFFDSGVMSGVRHCVSDLASASAQVGLDPGKRGEISLKPRVVGVKTDGEGKRMALVRYSPENM